MQQALELAKRISKELDKNWLSELQEQNLHKIFEPVFRLPNNIITLNTIVCAIIYSYSPRTKWVDLKKDGYEINRDILNGLNADLNDQIFDDFCNFTNEEIGESVGLFLDSLKDWRFVTIRKMIDFHGKTMREKEPDLKNVDEDKKPKVRENISRTMREAVFQREAADKLIDQLEKEFVLTNHKTKEDFGENYTDKTLELYESKNRDILSWRQFIKEMVLPKKRSAIQS